MNWIFLISIPCTLNKITIKNKFQISLSFFRIFRTLGRYSNNQSDFMHAGQEFHHCILDSSWTAINPVFSRTGLTYKMIDVEKKKKSLSFLEFPYFWKSMENRRWKFKVNINKYKIYFIHLFLFVIFIILFHIFHSYIFSLLFIFFSISIYFIILQSITIFCSFFRNKFNWINKLNRLN